MSQENVETVRRMIEAWHRGDYSASLEPTDPTIEVEAALGGDLDGTYRGHADVMEMLRAFWDEFEDQRTEIEECIPAGDDLILGVRFYGRGKYSGVEIDWPAWHVWSFRDGKAVRLRLLRSKEEAIEAAGLSE
jgi:ketosteroid isomerase-like protein